MTFSLLAVTFKLPSLFASGLQRLLLSRILLVTVGPLVGVALVAALVSNNLIQAQFVDDALGEANDLSIAINNKALLAARTANLVAGLPTTKELVAQGNPDALTAYLLPMKSRVSVDTLDMVDTSGRIIAGAQDLPGNRQLPEALLRRTEAAAEKAWALVDEPEGLTLRAIALVRGLSGEPIGMIEVGSLLGASFLKSVNGKGDNILVLAADGATRSATVPVEDLAVPGQEVNIDPQSPRVRAVTLQGQRYFAVFRELEFHSDEQITLGVLVPLARVEASRRTIVLALALAAVGLTAVGIGLSLFLAKKITAPLSALSDAAARIQKGDLNARVEHRSDHEIGVMETAFNMMADALTERDQERKVFEERLVEMATLDPLTGIPNRRSLEDTLERTVSQATPERSSALIYLDLDQFKLVNDTTGHHSGDQLLVVVADLLQKTLRKEDFLARLGGDEFAVVLNDVALESAVALAERLRQAVDRFRFSVNGRRFELSLSAGVALIDGQQSAAEVLARADMACYGAKTSGRNRVEPYREGANIVTGLSGDAEWSLELKDALQENRLRLVFQPIVSVNNGRVSSYEALLRLLGRDGRVILPMTFIPAAERTGLMQTIDEWVIMAAMRYSAGERAQGRPIDLAINLSGVTLRNPRCLAYVREALAMTNAEPRSLIFEITETALMSDLDIVKVTLESLRTAGCRFSLDDFGSGFSSFGYLAELPVDVLKIDGSFIHDLARNLVHQRIVRAIAEVAHSLEKSTVAEWVEDVQSFKLLRKLRVDFAQGYYIGRPSDPKENAHELVLPTSAFRARRQRLPLPV